MWSLLEGRSTELELRLAPAKDADLHNDAKTLAFAVEAVLRDTSANPGSKAGRAQTFPMLAVSNEGTLRLSISIQA